MSFTRPSKVSMLQNSMELRNEFNYASTIPPVTCCTPLTYVFRPKTCISCHGCHTVIAATMPDDKRGRKEVFQGRTLKLHSLTF